MDKRYQVFVSSTYEDLKEERKEVTQAILRCDCFPAGMELFPASSREKWEVIKRSIDDSDIFLVILAGRYGSFGKDTDGNEVGYTEMEFDYALSQGKPVIALLHRDLGTLPSSVVDGSGTKERKMLDAFRKRVQRERVISYWSSRVELGAEVMHSLYVTMRDEGTKLFGWTRLGHSSQTDFVWMYDTAHGPIAPIANGDVTSHRYREEDQGAHHKRSVRRSEESLCWWNVASVDYPSSISSVTAVMDIVHFHGLTWTNSNREFLLNCLTVPNIAVRVALLSTESAFFRAFAEYAELDERDLVRKHDEVVNIWSGLANSANEMTGGPVNFMLYDAEYFPAKSIYRFDNRVIITPNPITKDKSQFVAFECISKQQAKGQSAFDAAVREIDSVIRLGQRIV